MLRYLVTAAMAASIAVATWSAAVEHRASAARREARHAFLHAQALGEAAATLPAARRAGLGSLGLEP